jgi:hypothetical protein
MEFIEQKQQEPRELTLAEVQHVSGADNPGMGPYDGYGDHSAPYTATLRCGWTDYGRGISCVMM